MKREPYITKLDKNDLERYPICASFPSGDDLTPQLAVVSMVAWRGEERGYELICRSLSKRGTTVFLPRWGYREVTIPKLTCNHVEVEYDRWLEPYDRPVTTWVEVGDHIIYFAEDESFIGKTSWTFATNLERCFTKIGEMLHYRVVVGGEEAYLGLELAEARGTVPGSLEPTVLGNKFAQALDIAPLPLGVGVYFRYGPKGQWQEMNEAQLLQAGFRHVASAV